MEGIYFLKKKYIRSRKKDYIRLEYVNYFHCLRSHQSTRGVLLKMQNPARWFLELAYKNKYVFVLYSVFFCIFVSN